MNPVEQIAEVIKEHTWNENGLECTCGAGSDNWYERFVDYPAHVAAAVVEALGLTEERGVKFNHAEQVIILKDDAQYDDYGRNWSPLKRWVSGWSVVGGEPK